MASSSLALFTTVCFVLAIAGSAQPQPQGSLLTRSATFGVGGAITVSSNAAAEGIMVFDDTPLYLAAGNISRITLLPQDAGAGVQLTWNSIAASAMHGGVVGNDGDSHTLSLLEGEYINEVAVRISGTGAGATVSGLSFSTNTERTISNIPTAAKELKGSTVRTVAAPAGTILAAVRGAERYECANGSCARTLLQVQFVWAKLPAPLR